MHSDVNIQHLFMLVGGFRVVSNMFGDTLLGEILRVLPRLVDGGDAAVRAGVYAVGSGLYYTVYGGDGLVSGRGLLRGMEAQDGIWRVFGVRRSAAAGE
eukprot:3463795-Rhodomonas_salina.1